MTTATLEPRETGQRMRQRSPLAFTIEARTPRSCDVLIQSLDNTRLRGAIRPVKEVFCRDENGDRVMRSAPTGLIPGLPAEIPGMHLKVDPGDGSYTVSDPLRDDEDMCGTIQRAMSQNNLVRNVGKLRGVPPKSGRLNQDRTKTLVREMHRLVSADDARVVKGALPSAEDIDAMPGDYLTNPRASSGWRMPRYEKDVEEWEKSLNRVG